MTKTKTLPKFTTINQDEVKLEYRDMKFILKENKRGIYSIGKAVQLYRLDGLDKTHIKEIGWTKSDNHGGENGNESYLKGIHTWNECETNAVKYIDILLD